MSRFIILLVACASASRADVSYTMTSSYAGGDQLRLLGSLIPNMLDSGTTKIHLSGKRLIRRSDRNGTLIDLETKSIIRINYKSRTYTVTTFSQFEETFERIRPSGSQELKYRVDTRPSPAEFTFDGRPAKETLVSFTLGGRASFLANVWLWKDVEGESEIRTFQRQLASELQHDPIYSVATPMPGASLLGEMERAIQQLDGTPTVITWTAILSSETPPPVIPRLPTITAIQEADRIETEKARSLPRDAPTTGYSLITRRIFHEFSTVPVDASVFEIPAGFQKVESK